MPLDIHGLVDSTRTMVDNLVGLPTIQLAAWLNDDAWGKPIHASGSSIKSYLAVIDHKQRKYINKNGTEATSETTVTIIQQATVNLKDKIILPDGSSPAIADIRTTLDSSGNPFAVEILL